METADSKDTLQALEEARSRFEALVGEIRPELHRYCARMTGSVVDGEDILQDTLAKAFYSLPRILSGSADGIDHLRSWLFRIAHNKAIDFTRRYDRRFGEPLDGHADLPDDSAPIGEQEKARFGLSLFLKLTPAQRGAVILKDVLGHSLEEIGSILDLTVPAVKGALHRGRASLRRLAAETIVQAPAIDPAEVHLLEMYTGFFQDRDFDRLRQMLASDVRLDVVNITGSKGSAPAGNYYTRYAKIENWRAAVGLVEGRPAILMFETSSAEPQYFVLIEWQDGRIVGIRDFRYARYAMESAQYSLLEPQTGTASAVRPV